MKTQNEKSPSKSVKISVNGRVITGINLKDIVIDNIHYIAYTPESMEYFSKPKYQKRLDSLCREYNTLYMQVIDGLNYMDFENKLICEKANRVNLRIGTKHDFYNRFVALQDDFNADKNLVSKSITDLHDYLDANLNACLHDDGIVSESMQVILDARAKV